MKNIGLKTKFVKHEAMGDLAESVYDISLGFKSGSRLTIQEIEGIRL
jgi:hypothetical protein